MYGTEIKLLMNYACLPSAGCASMCNFSVVTIFGMTISWGATISPPPPPVKGVPLTNWGRHQKIKKLIGGYVLTSFESAPLDAQSLAGLLNSALCFSGKPGIRARARGYYPQNLLAHQPGFQPY